MNKSGNNTSAGLGSGEENLPPLTNHRIARLLIANRGEIACRIIKTAKKLGITTIAVYSEVDRQTKHVAMADEAILIGKAPAQDSYLNIPKILKAAQSTKADAIHPGYGFLSENAQFADACSDNGIIFIGPPAKAMHSMSSKSEAKTIMDKAQVPLIPGYHGDDNSVDKFLAAANQVGYPILLKAALGGGGKGMRIVNSNEEMPEAIASAKRESKSAFGDDRLLLEKYFTTPRHIEVQIFADQLGHTVYLSDRDCSIQRRHQKIVEEAPAPGLSATLRQAMGKAAIDAAKAIGYVGAGTVEFLLDTDGKFYFMEMNTRLQVEHPVTELITGQDLVEWQIKIAQGSSLPVNQRAIRHHGHAIEVRIYAEDPNQDFIPSSGHIHYLQEPKPQSTDTCCIRVDSGIRQSDNVTSHYDPMLAKLIVWTESREQASQALSSALIDYRLIGLTTNIQYLQKVIRHPAFIRAKLNTRFVELYQTDLESAASPHIKVTNELPDTNKDSIALPKLAFFAGIAVFEEILSSKKAPNFHGWRLNQPPYQNVTICQIQGDYYQFRFQRPYFTNINVENNIDAFRTQQLFLEQVSISAQATIATKLEINILSAHIEALSPKQTCFHIEIDGVASHFIAVQCQGQYHIFHQHYYQPFEVNRNTNYQHLQEQETKAIAPLNGIVSALLCQPGDKVNKDQPLMVIEAMKMEYTIRAPQSGTIDTVLFCLGDQVEHGEQVVSFRTTAKAQK